MKNNKIQTRKSIRLKYYDYSQAGMYFVTVCVDKHKSVFGSINNGKMALNDVGNMVEKWWKKLPAKFNNIGNDIYIIMPNHIHGIISIVGADPCVCPDIVGADPCVCPDIVGADPCVCPDSKKGEHTGSPLHKIIQWFKTMSTNEYIRNVKNAGWPPFDKKFWQRNFYEHIIRNEKELESIYDYIQNNPNRWEFDRENPDGKPDDTERDFWNDFL